MTEIPDKPKVPSAPNPAEAASAERTIERMRDRSEAPKLIVAKQGDVSHVKLAGDPAVEALRMLDTFATVDKALAGALLSQILSATSNGDAVDGAAAQAMLAQVHGIAPQDEAEALLAVQMAAIHNAVMASTFRLAQAGHQAVRDSEATILNKLARTFAAQLEALRKHRAPSEQRIVVQHVHVNEGGQAVVAGGDLTPGPRGGEKAEGQPHETGSAVALASGAPLQSQVEAHRPAVPGAGGAGTQGLPVPRGSRRRAAR